MLDRALRLAFRNYSTLFFIVAAVTVPAHVLYGFVFRDVVAVTELHPAIEQFPGARQVRSVGKTQLQTYRIGYVILTGAEIMLLPFLVRAARRVAEIDGARGLPLVGDAWRSALKNPIRRPPGPRQGAGRLLVPLLIAVSVIVLLERLGLILAGPFPDAWAFAPVGLVQGIARAAGAPFLLAAAADLGRRP